MGSITIFNLREYIEKYNIKTFLETGVERGNGVTYAQKFNFENILSVDIDKSYYNKAVDKFKDDKRVKIHFGYSTDFLNEVLPINGNILFWLDAHFPQTYLDGHLVAGYFDEKMELGEEYLNKLPENVRLPVEEELKIIIEKQDICNSVFFIDDYRCYEPESGNFQYGKHQNRHLLGCTTNSEFFNDLLYETHDITIDRRQTGYLIATPKNK